MNSTSNPSCQRHSDIVISIHHPLHCVGFFTIVLSVGGAGSTHPTHRPATIGIQDSRNYRCIEVPQKWMVYNGKPLLKWDDLGGKPTIL